MTLDQNGYVRCAECGTPVARLDGDTLVVVARHHGERHTTSLDVRDLAAALVSAQEREESA